MENINNNNIHIIFQTVSAKYSPRNYFQVLKDLKKYE